MFLDLLMSPITAPISGLSWIAEKILEQAEPELDEKENLGKRLLSLQLAFDMGDLSEEDFEEQEEALLLAMQELEDSKRLEAQAEEEEALLAEVGELESAEDNRPEAEVPPLDISDLNRLAVNTHIDTKDRLETKVAVTR